MYQIKLEPNLTLHIRVYYEGIWIYSLLIFITSLLCSFGRVCMDSKSNEIVKEKTKKMKYCHKVQLACSTCCYITSLSRLHTRTLSCFYKCTYFIPPQGYIISRVLVHESLSIDTKFYSHYSSDVTRYKCLENNITKYLNWI